MESLVWSVVLAVIGILGIYIAGRKSYWGWAIGLFAQLLWLIFAIVTAQYGFVLSAIAYGVVYGRNWVRWWDEQRRSQRGFPRHGTCDRPPRGWYCSLHAGHLGPCPTRRVTQAHWNGQIE